MDAARQLSRSAQAAGLAAALVALVLLARPAYPTTLELQVRHTHGGAPLLLDSLRYSLRSGETLSVTRLSYLLSGFALEGTEGGWIELPGQFAWIDAERRRTSVTLREVPPGEYRALRFAVGLDPQTNGGDPAKWPANHPLNPSLNGLHWSWQGGYIFVALEGHWRADGAKTHGYSYHFARDTNRVFITISVGLKLAEQAVAIGLDFDLAALLDGPRPISPARDGTSTHSRDGDAIAAALRLNLLGAFRLREVAGQECRNSAAAAKPLYLPAAYTPHAFRFSARFPMPDLPRDNPLTEERIELGRRLFHEPLLSRDRRLTCASCHEAAHAFADPRQVSLGVDGQAGTRNAMPLFNLAWKQSFFWDGRAPSLRAQVLMPIQDHAEMDEKLSNVVRKVASADYDPLFTRAFGSPEVTAEKMALALENFLLTLTSHDSKFDRAMRGAAELTTEERRGFELFFTEHELRSGRFGADCFHCHGGALFTDHQFHNNGLALAEGGDTGRERVTGKAGDQGKFATPSLRNVALTAPYMHDGRFTTLDQVLDHYSGGVQRSATLDANLAKHPDGGVPLSVEDKRALVSFLKALTDDSLGQR